MRVIPRDVVDLRGVTENPDGSRLRFADDPNVEITTIATNDIGATDALQKEKIMIAFSRQATISKWPKRGRASCAALCRHICQMSNGCNGSPEST